MSRPRFIRRRCLKAIVVGASAGGVQALDTLLSLLPADLQVPLVIVQHIHPAEDDGLAGVFAHRCPLVIKDAEDKEEIRAGTVYFAPPDYHLLIERAGTFALSVDEKVNYARPSVDVLFESAAHVWHSQLLAIVLTGANNDGAQGIRVVKACGGTTIAQDPATAPYAAMPQAAIDTGALDRVLSLEGIGEFIRTRLRSMKS